MQQTIEYLYNRFLTGMKPTQQDFRDLMDSFFHKADLDATLQRLEAISLGEGEAWQVDNALDEGSIQPVQNKVVAARLRELGEALAATDSRLSTAAQGLADAVAAIGTKASAADLTTLREAYTAFVAATNTALGSKADASNVYSKTEADNLLGGKLDKNQGAANAGKVPKVNARGELELTDDVGEVKSVSVNGGTRVRPGADGNINLEIEEGGGSLEGLKVNGRAVTPDGEGNVNIEVVEGVSLNGIRLEKDAEGNVDLHIELPETDNSLDATSTNPVENRAVATAIAELQNPTFEADVVEVDGEQQVTLSTMSGRPVAQFRVSGGGGGGDTSTSKILLTATVSAAKVKEGGHSVLSWYYNHVNSENQADGVSGDVTVTVSRGAVTLHEETLTNVSPSEAAHQIVLDAWLTTAGTVGVTMRATANDGGTVQTKRYYVAVTVVSLELVLNNSAALIGKAMSGGYADGETITVGYTLKGSGTKEVSLYVDGSGTPMTQTVTRAGTTNGQFALAASGLTAGRHVLQLVAENDGLMSESTYIDILKAGQDAPFIGLLFTTGDGTIYGSEEYLAPTLGATQYVSMGFDWFAYDPGSTTAQVTEYRGGVETQTFAVGRSRQTYAIRPTGTGTISEWLVCGGTEYQFYIEVAASSIEVSKATAGLEVELLAAGRSNDESDPAQWRSGGVTTQFSGFDWQSSGWDGDALVARNGARFEIAVYPYETDAAITGRTVEIEFKVSNVIDMTADIISCMSSGKGFRVTGSKASMLSGSGVPMVDGDGNQVTDEHGDTVYRLVGVEKTFAEDTWVKMAFVTGPRSQNRLMELYINGTREKADIYNTTDNFVQDAPAGITFDSAGADIEVRSVRVYNRAISDDEEVDNYIVDRLTPEEMLAKYEGNDVLENGEYDITKIRAKGKGVVHFIRSGGLDPVNSANNKKTDFLTDFIYYSPFGREWDLKTEGCNVRIQGTSSTKYPRKNYRIYLLKPSTAKVYRRGSNGEWEEDTDFTGYIFREGDREAVLICLKADYSDSSMTMNTGGAKLFDMLMRELGYLTPPQEVDPCVRQAIDGFPVDVFCTDTDDPTNAVKYYGQYNFNHDKGKSKNIFGHVKIRDDEDVEHNFGASIALEGLNNTNPFCLYQSAGSAGSAALSDQLDASFDDGWEFNHPEDTVWSSTPESGQTTATAEQRTAIKRLFGWIYDCFMQTAGVAGGTMTAANPDYGTPGGWTAGSKAKWVCSKFKNELQNYFHVNHLLTYYVFTDYYMSVDQRAKNTILRTWDYMKWYITYYDGDCQLGMRNDSFLAYLYTLSRDTWDADKSKYGFEGHDSWLWCLILANFEDELKAAAKAMRNILTNEVVLRMLNEEQMGNWCERAYNKSGEFKYIVPATEGVTVVQNGVTQTGVKYPFVYALNGTNYSHRVHTILHRFALLDAKYGCDTYKGDNVEMYLSRQAGDEAGTIVIRSNAPYFFDWNTKNGRHSDPQETTAGGSVTLTFTEAITVNDPVDLYGASCMERIDLSGVAGSLQNGINLNKATLLREIDAASATVWTQVWFFNFEQCKRLRLVDCTNHFGVKTGTSSSTEFDVSFATRLEVLRLGGTGVQSVELAEGAPLTEVVLPATLAVLKLRYLPLLTAAGLTIEGYNGITTLNFAQCPGLDWVELAGLCPNLDRLRVEGVSMEDDGTVLNRFKTLRGVDGDGNAVAKCQLVGDVWLTRYPAESDLEGWMAAYPSLNIHLPEYTMIERDENVADPANMSNLDNGTGYKYGTGYVPSGHVTRILEQRHRCMAKMTAEGEMTYYPLHDMDSRYYADGVEASLCTPATLDGTEGDVMMYEPHYWYKGVNDVLGRKYYMLFSSKESMPKVPEGLTVLERGDVETFHDGYRVIMGGVGSSVTQESNSSYAVCRVAVSGWQRVRFPTVVGTGLMGSVFTDGAGVVLKQVCVDTGTYGFESGMYVIDAVPEGAEWLYFTILKSAPFDYVVLSNNPKIEDMEPYWVEHEVCMVGVAESSTVGDKLMSVMRSSTSAGDMTWTRFHDSSALRGMQMIDYEMHKDIANLFYAKYGPRNSQGQCGYGSESSTLATNRTALLGMRDTVNPNNETTGAWYWNTENPPELVSLGSVNCMGYQNLFGNKAEWMDGVRVNVGSVTGRWTIDMPDGTQRLVKGGTTSGIYIKNVAHGRFMDVLPIGSAGASSTTRYCDYYYYSGSTGRVVYRSNNNANANGGVSYANANNAPSNSNANIGSRLNYRSGQTIACLLIYRPTPLLDASLCGVPRGTSPTSSSRMAGKVKKHDYRAGLGRRKAEEAGPGERKAMRREKDIMKEVVSYPNIYAAIDEVLSGTMRKSTREGREILEHRDEVIARLQGSLADGSFEIGDFYEKTIVEAGKERRIQVLTMETRIGANAVMRVVDEHLRRRFIRTTSASIKGRGMHDLMKYLRDDRRRDPEGTAYCYKADIKKFYESIDQEAVLNCVRRVFKDPVLLVLLEKFVHMMPKGLSVGLRSSQGLANLLLSTALDHPLKDGDGLPYYYRYCDDIVILGGSKKELWTVRDRVHELVGAVGLEIKANERVFPSSEGIDFLGYVIYSGEHVELRKRIKQKMARKMGDVKSRKRRAVLTASFYGMAKHADCNNLFLTLTGISMKSFKDLGVSYAPADGKKHFPGLTVSIHDLVNLPIVVKDFETGIKTAQGDDRTLVAFEQNGEPKKFFTSSVEMRNILEQIRELPDGFPFETTIKTEAFGKGKTKFVFS